MRTLFTRLRDRWHTATLRLASVVRDDDAPANGRLSSVGAWAGLDDIRNPERTVATALALGLDAVHIIVNDHAKQRLPPSGPLGPTGYPSADIVALAGACHAAGLEVHLMSWMTPHADYTRVVCSRLVSLAVACRAKSVVLDLEEPQTQARLSRLRRVPLSRYAEHAREVLDLLIAPLRGLGVEVGFTAIRYADAARVGPIAAHCDYGLVQAYATKSSGADPLTVVALGVAAWRKRFGAALPIRIALAAYRQAGLKGYSTVGAAMLAAAGAAADVTRTVVYWYIPTIRASPATARALTFICAHDGDGVPAPQSDVPTERLA